MCAPGVEAVRVGRTGEGGLMPRARGMGLGVTPWSPLKSGVLSGKYTRANAATVKADRGERVTQNLGEKVYAIIDELIAIGKTAGIIAEAAREAGLEKSRTVASVEEAAEILAEETSPNDLVLIKGSRAARTERVLEEFAKNQSPQGIAS